MQSPSYRAALAVMYGCGLRISEAVKVQVGDVDSERMVIRVVGKGDKERLVPLPAPLYQDLRKMWATHRHPQWLFANKRGTNHVDMGTLRRAFRLACNEVGIPKGITPHSLRHSFGTRLMEKGVPIESISILMGHTTIQTTMVYLHMTEALRTQINETAASFSIPLFD